MSRVLRFNHRVSSVSPILGNVLTTTGPYSYRVPARVVLSSCKDNNIGGVCGTALVTYRDDHS